MEIDPSKRAWAAGFINQAVGVYTPNIPRLPKGFLITANGTVPDRMLKQHTHIETIFPAASLVDDPTQPGSLPSGTYGEGYPARKAHHVAQYPDKTKTLSPLPPVNIFVVNLLPNGLSRKRRMGSAVMGR
jgi:hypothetical protein